MGEVDEILRRERRDVERQDVYEDALHAAEVSLLSAIAMEAKRIALDPRRTPERLIALREAYVTVAPMYMDPGADLG